jgi:hypothetical protein
MNKYTGVVLWLLIFIVGCNSSIPEEELLSIGITECRRQPLFIKNTGFQPQRSALSTSEKRIKGLVLVELPVSAADTNRRSWQHPSWNKFGWMGPITTDEAGNTYVAPVPVINVLDNATDKQSIIYKVESGSGEMTPFINLQNSALSATDNPYGLLGIYYDCHGKCLYASTVAGSTREAEKGKIFVVDASTKKITDELTGKDALGLCVGGMTGEKKLYFGSARQPLVYSVLLTPSGKFNGQPKQEFSLDMLGPRGDDKARRIRFDKNGDMLIYGIAFNYNLTAPTEKQESFYRLRYYDDVKKWMLVK